MPLLVFGVDAADAVRRAAPAGARRRRLRRRDGDRHVAPARRRAACVLRRDPFYRRFGLGRGIGRAPSAASLRALLRLGVPMGLSMMVEVTGFTFMAFFVSRIGATAGRRPPDRGQHGVDDVHAAAGDRQRVEHAGRAAARRRRPRRRAPARLGRPRDRRRHRRRASAPRSTCCASRWSASTPPTR